VAHGAPESPYDGKSVGACSCLGHFCFHDFPAKNQYRCAISRSYGLQMRDQALVGVIPALASVFWMIVAALSELP
jgi:hypothetical protein